MKKVVFAIISLVALQCFAQDEAELWAYTTKNGSLEDYQLFAFLHAESEHFETAVKRVDSLQQLSKSKVRPCEEPSCLDLLLNADGYALVGFSFKKHDQIMDEFRKMLVEGKQVDIKKEVHFKTELKNSKVSDCRAQIELPVHCENSYKLYKGLVNELMDYRDNMCHSLFGIAYVELIPEDQRELSMWLAKKITLIHQEPMFPMSD